MNKNNSEETKQLNNQPGANRDGSDATNSDVTRMYDASSMTSGPGDATQEERNKVKAESAANGTSKK
ncbi:hypothetical protein LGK95_07165 [Clostridium algoriphilum]|uniref:hypothetical protein n=1 Tax=Clostridium algoriphilum TaxID=198347 RepID=UPI001CF1B95A|nr:hypothetical protein [Clostridium algoriphilum]MCB2293298.1 hypothetical protein [Clostridium algoriphilum]